MKYFAIVIAVFLTGCAANPFETFEPGEWGYIDTSTSMMDGVTTIRLNPIFTYKEDKYYEAAYLHLGASWKNGEWRIIASSKKPTVWKSAYTLELKIDGKLYELKPVNEHSFGFDSNYGVASTSTVYQKRHTDKKYLADEGLIKAIANAKHAVVKGYTSQGYIEGDLLPNKYPQWDRFVDHPEQSLQARFKEFHNIVLQQPAIATSN